MNEPDQENTSGMIPEPPQQVAIIVDDEQLAAFVERMCAAPWITVDTEFQRERTYYPQLSLLQIADAHEIGLIDMLAIDDTTPLKMLVSDSGPLKVFHAADQDIEVLYQTLAVMPAPLFDTQIAAALSGLGDQIGYAGLVQELTGVKLAKAHTRTNWLRRPLPAQVLTYAADDVRWLAVCYPLLQQQLHARGRLAWVQADSQTLTAAQQQHSAPANAWQRVRAWHHLEPRAQQVLAELADWRERTAMQADRPRKWILPDDALLEIARTQPQSQQQLEAIRALAPKTARRHGAALLDCVVRGGQRPAQPLAPDYQPLDDAQKRLCKQARRALAICAEHSGIPAPTLARRKELEQMVTGARDLRVLHGWRADAAGCAILDVVEGRQQVIGKGAQARLASVASHDA